MDMSGSQPPPPAAPAPAPRKSGWVKWVIIGCGGVTLLFGACCVGFGFLGYLGVQKAMQEMGKQFEPLIQGNEIVQRELGEDVKITPSFQFKEEVQDGKKVVRWTWDAEGKKGKGKILFFMQPGADNKTQTWDLSLEDASGQRKRIGRWVIEEGKGFRQVEMGTPEE